MMPSLFDLLVAVPLLLGTFFTLASCVGLVRLPDVYCRMHASGKAGTLGVCLVVFATAVYFSPDGPGVPLRGLLAILFQFLTTPAAMHLLARGAYLAKYPLTDRTAIDELEDYLGAHAGEPYGKE
jgi:multicomponent Na+:H+ antiporter subunit G